MISDACAAPEINVVQNDAAAREFVDEPGQDGHHAEIGLCRLHLAADVTGDALDADHRELGGFFVERNHLSELHAEFAVAESGGDMRVDTGINVGIDAHGNVRLNAETFRDGMNAVEFSGRLDVEALDSGAKRERDVGDRLPDAGEDDLLRISARFERTEYFAAAHAVEARALTGDKFEDAAGGRRLYGVADLVGLFPESLFISLETLRDSCARIDVERRA